LRIFASVYPLIRKKGKRLLLLPKKIMGTIGHLLIELQEVNSTNRHAERILRNGEVEEGTVINAWSQTDGKGQGENRWQSEPGQNLTISIILHPLFLQPGMQFVLNKAISLGVLDAVSHYLDGVKIKWPNDILAGSKKIGGILIQHAVEGAILKDTIVGIGLNVNQKDFGPGLPDAASLAMILHREVDLKELLTLLCDTLEMHYSLLKEEGTSSLEADYCTALLGFRHERMFLVEGNPVSGIIQGVDEFGRLLVEHPGGGFKAYAHREIEFLVNEE